MHRLATLRMRNILATPSRKTENFHQENNREIFCHKNSNFIDTIGAFCCFVLISTKWISLDIFNNKWDNKYQLNAAKGENCTRRSGVQKQPSLCRQSQKQIKKLSYTGFFTAIFRFYGKKKRRNCSILTIRNI